jgi:Ner family transcriptional regulator
MSRSAQDWHKADVKAALEKKGLTMTAVALRHGLDPSAVRQSLREQNRRQFTRIKALIAAAIGLPPQTIWPSLFDSNGQPYWKRRPHKRSTQDGRRNVSGSRHRAA